MVWYNPLTWFSSSSEEPSVSSPEPYTPAVGGPYGGSKRRKTRRGRKGSKRSKTGRSTRS